MAIRRIRAALVRSPLRDPAHAAARKLGTLTATLRPYLAGDRGRPRTWGKRGGAASLARIADLLRPPIDAFTEDAPAEALAGSGVRAGPRPTVGNPQAR